MEEGSQVYLQKAVSLPWLLPCALVPVVRIQLSNNGSHAKAMKHSTSTSTSTSLSRCSSVFASSLLCCGVQSCCDVMSMVNIRPESKQSIYASLYYGKPVSPCVIFLSPYSVRLAEGCVWLWVVCTFYYKSSLIAGHQCQPSRLLQNAVKICPFFCSPGVLCACLCASQGYLSLSMSLSVLLSCYPAVLLKHQCLRHLLQFNARLWL